MLWVATIGNGCRLLSCRHLDRFCSRWARIKMWEFVASRSPTREGFKGSAVRVQAKLCCESCETMNVLIPRTKWNHVVVVLVVDIPLLLPTRGRYSSKGTHTSVLGTV